MSSSFQDLLVWQKGHQFVLLVYQVTSRFPNYERFGLTSQFQRAAVSIPANIAEGYKKMGKSDKLRFLNIAQGSLEECRYYIILSKDLGYITDNDAYQMNIIIEDTSRLLNAYGKKIKESTFANDFDQ